MKKVFFCMCLLSSLAWADHETPAEPLIVQHFSDDMTQIRNQLKDRFQQAEKLIRSHASDQEYLALLTEVQELKKQKDELEEKWRRSFAIDAAGDDPYALWDAGETTLSQLIMEYGASEYLYVIPPELSAVKISLFSGIPLPRESWGEMLEMILAHNGVGIKKINSFVKQLYILKLDPSAIEGIVSREEDLAFFEPQSRLFFVFSPKAEQVRSVQGFFERFSDPRQTTVQSIASKIVCVSTRETIEKLLSLFHAVWEQNQGKVIRFINLTKVTPADAEKVLKTVFGDMNAKTKTPFFPGVEDLSVLTLPQGIVLAGESDAVQRGERILADLEQQLEDPGEKIVYWYSCKHSNPEDIASVLSQVYDSLSGAQMDKKNDPASEPSPLSHEAYPPGVFPSSNPTYNPVLPVNPGFVQPAVMEKQQKSSFGHFVVDAKTASILMIVRREELPKIKSLLKKLDVPKRMVQIDVMLVEKKLQDRKQVGINLLNINSSLKMPPETGISFQTDDVKPNKGLLQFIFKRPLGKFPGIDLAYNFLLARDDLRINANPSVLAVNQTPAQISIVEEISINNGAVQLDTSSSTVEKSYTRAQYGTTIVMLPTIHMPDADDGHPGLISLHTDVTFDTTQISFDDRPPVTRRHVANDVQIADGETVILGGLRRRAEEDRREKIPFLGDLPGIGKLFGADKSTDSNTEMFIFITPHIIRDPVDDLKRLRTEECQKRAGDIPEFLSRLEEAKEKEKKCLFANSIKVLFDGR